MADQVAVFKPSTADELIKSLEFNKVNQREFQPTFTDTTNIYLAFTTGGATARSGSTCGTGTAVLQRIDETNAISAVGNDLDFINLATSAVGTNKYILLARVSCRLVCIWEEC
jgi:hypothetical protein